MSGGAKLLLCIDCGGSKTSAVAACAATGKLVVRAHGGPSNLAYSGILKFTTAIKDTMTLALADQAAIDFLGSELYSLPITGGSSPFHSAWIAVSGVDTPSDIEAVTSSMSSLLGIPRSNCRVTNDTHLLSSPLQHSEYPTCLAFVAGTGSCIVSFKKENGIVAEAARSGGYGWMLGDEGSGYHVGRETVRRLCIEDDTKDLNPASTSDKSSTSPKPTHDLRSLVLEKFGLPPTAKASDIFRELYAAHPVASPAGQPTDIPAHRLLERSHRLACLAPVVFKAAFPPLIHDKEFVPHPSAITILRSCLAEVADMMSLILAPKDTPIPPGSRYIHAHESILSCGGSLVKQLPYRTLLADIMKERGHEFPQVVFVDDCESAGVKALFTQIQLTS